MTTNEKERERLGDATEQINQRLGELSRQLTDEHSASTCDAAIMLINVLLRRLAARQADAPVGRGDRLQAMSEYFDEEDTRRAATPRPAGSAE